MPKRKVHIPVNPGTVDPREADRLLTAYFLNRTPKEVHADLKEECPELLEILGLEEPEE